MRLIQFIVFHESIPTQQREPMVVDPVNQYQKLIRVELIFSSNTTCLFVGRGAFTLLPKVQLGPQ